MNDARDTFDDALRGALQRRAEQAAPADLAARAMHLAATHAAAIEPARLRRFRLFTQFASLAAIVLIGLFIYLGVNRLANHGNLSLTPGDSYTETSAASSAATSSTSTSSDSQTSLSWTIAVGVIALTGLGAAAVIRQSSPFAGAAGMGRFA